MNEIEKVFLELQKNPTNQINLYQNLSNLVESGILITEIEKILKSDLNKHQSLKPFILIFLNDFVSSKNKNIIKNEDLLLYLNSIISIILRGNLNFNLKTILAKSITILANQIEFGNIDFIFSQFLNDFMNVNFELNEIEGYLIVITHFFKSYKIIENKSLYLKILENVFSSVEHFGKFFELLQKIFSEN